MKKTLYRGEPEIGGETDEDGDTHQYGYSDDYWN